MTTTRTAGGYGEETNLRPPDQTATPCKSTTDLDGRMIGGGRYWLISHPGHDSTGTPVPRLTCGGRVLPVFSSGEEAAEFSSFLPGDWRIRAVDAGELLPILLGPSCTGVETVELDPIPGLPEEVSARLVGVGAGRFVLHLALLRGRPDGTHDAGEAVIGLGPEILRSMGTEGGVAFRTPVGSNLVGLRGRWRENVSGAPAPVYVTRLAGHPGSKEAGEQITGRRGGRV